MLPAALLLLELLQQAPSSPGPFHSVAAPPDLFLARSELGLKPLSLPLFMFPFLLTYAPAAAVRVLTSPAPRSLAAAAASLIVSAALATTPAATTAAATAAAGLAVTASAVGAATSTIAAVTTALVISSRKVILIIVITRLFIHLVASVAVAAAFRKQLVIKDKKMMLYLW